MAKRPRRRAAGGFDVFEARDLVGSISTLLPSQKLLLFVLLQFTNKDGECWPSMPRLAIGTSLNPVSIQRLFPGLKRLGVLHVEPRLRPSDFGKVSAASNLYRIDLAALRALTLSPDKVLAIAQNEVCTDPVDNSNRIPVENQRKKGVKF